MGKIRKGEGWDRAGEPDFDQALAECVGGFRGVGNPAANHSGEGDIIYSFFSLSLRRISSIIFLCSRQMETKMVSIGQGLAM